ncbi:MAG: NAD-dependent epimerase/dehydratase family protein [Planctomycetota bacterium]|jgi:nucleoside-diphosphate-sugar epimerase
MDERPVLFLGCGYTATRAARTLLARGRAVFATSRNPRRLDALAAAGARVLPLTLSEPGSLLALAEAVPDDLTAVHSIPPLREEDGLRDPTPRVVQGLGRRFARVVTISSTGVYGSTREVDAGTKAAPETERQRMRVHAEETAEDGPWSSLVLRPAAIYGPGRGIHVAIRRGSYRLVGDGSNVVSRIHVDDLATHLVAAVDAEVEGRYPVADAAPATAREVATFCADRLGVELPPPVRAADVGETLRVTRRVDGRRIRHLLGITLRYPSYREGIPAALGAET